MFKLLQTQYSLSWNKYSNNVCDGLSKLQQDGEFVDMTIAADGYYVKVHRMVLSLISPFIKDIITSIQSSHPVLFLNNISYSTLCLLLEYIYKGEVLVSKETLGDLIQAGKSLHIKGLEDMSVEEIVNPEQHSKLVSDRSKSVERNVINAPNDVDKLNDDDKEPQYCTVNDDDYVIEDMVTEIPNTEDTTEWIEEMDATETFDESTNSVINKLSCVRNNSLVVKTSRSDYGEDSSKDATQIQYTISNQGNIQLILNRFMYYIRYIGRSHHRTWRCIDYIRAPKCKAYVITENDTVLQRVFAHNHPFHDQNILKKVSAGAVFKSLLEAEEVGERKKQELQSPTDE